MTTLQTPTTTHSAYSFDTDSQVDELGHAYLPFHPRSFGFPFGFEASSSNNHAGEIAARQASDLLAGMLANPVDLAVGFGVGDGKAGERPTGLGVKGIDDDRHRADGVRLWAHVDPSELNIDRRSSGASVEEGMDSASSSRSVSPEPEIKVDGKTKRSSIKIDTDVPKRTGMVSVSAADEEMIVCVVPPKRGTRRKSSAVSDLLEEDEDVSERKSKKVKLASKRNSTSTSSSFTSNNTTNVKTNTAHTDRPISAFHITDPPHPFSFKDLGLAPPPPFLGAGDVEHASGDDDGEDEGADGMPVKGKRREMNRVAAKRHREKNKDRLKSLETRKAWLDHAVDEYEKSNKRLSETLDRLKRENVMLKSAEVVA